MKKQYGDMIIVTDMQEKDVLCLKKTTSIILKDTLYKPKR